MTKTKTIPRIQTLPGSLSLHTYRKHLLQPDSPDRAAPGDKKLKRKYGVLNLNQIPTHPPARAPWSPLSASSVASSPPPLSPSYSLSAVSQFSEIDREKEREPLERFVCPEMAAFQEVSSEYAVRARQGGRKFETFRDRLGQTPQLHEPTDSATGRDNDPTMVSHDGASFQILNPRQSLKVARIVSYIEDMEYSTDICASRSGSWCPGRDVDEKGIPESDEIAPEDASQQNDLDLIDLLSNHNTDDDHNPPDEAELQAHLDIMGDIPGTPIPSISERLQANHHGSAQTPPNEHERRSLKDTGLDSGHQGEKVNEPGKLCKSSPRTEAFATLSGAYPPNMQGSSIWNQMGAGSMPAATARRDAESGPTRHQTTKPAPVKEGRAKGTVLGPLRKLRCW